MKKLFPLPENKIKVFVDEYYSRVNISINNKYMPFIICPVGRIKSGKTTLTENLAKQIGIPKVSNDEVRILLRIENNFKSSDYQKIIPLVLDYFIEKNTPLVVDCNAANPWTKSLLEKISSKNNIPLIWIHVNPKDNWIIEKLKTFDYEDGQLFTGPEDGLRRFHEHLLNFPDISDIKFDCIIDSSKENYIGNIENIGLDLIKKYKE